MKQMPLVESLRVLRSLRTNEVVVTSMGTAREWMALGTHPLDFVHVPSSMGQSASLGLGIALARPDCRVIACCGDGSTLMNLGALVTITAEAPPNLALLVFDNSCYEVTGAQATPGTAGARKDGTPIELGAVAWACGFKTVHTFDDLEDWRREAPAVISAAGPVFALLRVAPVPGAVGPKSPGHAPTRARAFATALRDH